MSGCVNAMLPQAITLRGSCAPPPVVVLDANLPSFEVDVVPTQRGLDDEKTIVADRPQQPAGRSVSLLALRGSGQ